MTVTMEPVPETDDMRTDLCTWCGHFALIGDPCQWSPSARHERGAK